MPLYEYRCLACQIEYEEIRSSASAKESVCPQCSSAKTEKRISAFKVAGRGDLRESTLHGCHEAHVPAPGEKSGKSGGGCGGGSHEGHSH